MIRYRIHITLVHQTISHVEYENMKPGPLDLVDFDFRPFFSFFLQWFVLVHHYHLYYYHHQLRRRRHSIIITS